MKAKVSFIVCLVTICFGYSQSHELGLVLGGANFIGDIGSTTYVNPETPAFGGVYKLNRSTRHTYRLSFVHHKIEGSDLKSDAVYRQKRGRFFKNAVNELALGMEFSFWEFNLHESGPQATPYIYFGVGLVNYRNFYNTGVKELEYGRSNTMVLPVGLGYKLRLIDQLILGAEINAKYTFSDNLDGSSPEFLSGTPQVIGNDTNTDWYMFTGITLTYTFGKRPCLCNF